MARYEVYPKAWLSSSGWELVLRVLDMDTDEQTEYRATAPGTAGRWRVPKLVLELDGPSSPDEIRDLFLSDDIRPGPQTETVWEAFVDTAEGNTAWTKQDTAKLRQALSRGLSGYPWTLLAVEVHEIDGTVTEAI